MITAKISATITRPANTTAYAPGDVISDTPGTQFVFAGLPLRVGEGGLIETAICIDSVAAATPPDAELWLFDTPPAAIADNAPFAPSDAELLNLVGIITFATDSFKKGSNNEACVQSNLGLSFHGDVLYGVLVVRNAYTPASGEVFKIVFSVIR